MITIIAFALLLFLPDFSCKLTRDQVKRGISNWCSSENPEERIHMIIERKGDDAGEIGYFFVDLLFGDSLIIPADARLGLKTVGDKNFLDYYTQEAIKKKGPPRFDDDTDLKLKSLVNRVIGHKNGSQKWWEYYLGM
jgi:hypothetical protein